MVMTWLLVHLPCSNLTANGNDLFPVVQRVDSTSGSISYTVEKPRSVCFGSTYMHSIVIIR